jgi:hypothetical protein
MGIDAPWHHELAAGVYNIGTRGGVEVKTNLGDPAILAVNICLEALLRCYSGTTFNDDAHCQISLVLLYQPG